MSTPSPENSTPLLEGAPLTGRRIALPESRELNVLAALLTRRGAEVLRCPLLSILDTPNTAAVEAWLRRFIASPPGLFVIFTGEGLRRLMGFAERCGLDAGFLEALAAARKLSRGPKPARVLREWGLVAELMAESPTTEGVIRSLEVLDLETDAGEGQRLAVQLYGTDPNERLRDYLQGRGLSTDYVAPYVYASRADEAQVRDLIDALVARQVHAIAFTSAQQLKRILEVAEGDERRAELEQALHAVVVAAVGPVVAEALRQAGLRVQACPNGSYFMKPMVMALSQALASH